MRIGVLTGGGDCPGLNAVIRAVVRTCDARYGSSVVGFLDGWRGLLEDRPDWFTQAAAEDCERVAQRVDSVVADLAALQERAHALQDEFTSRQAEMVNKRFSVAGQRLR